MTRSSDSPKLRPIGEYTVAGLIRRHGPAAPTHAQANVPKRYRRVAEIFDLIQKHFEQEQAVAGSGAAASRSADTWTTRGMGRIRRDLRLSGQALRRWVDAYQDSLSAGNVRIPAHGGSRDRKRASQYARAVAALEANGPAIELALKREYTLREFQRSKRVRSLAPELTELHPRMLRRALRACGFPTIGQTRYDQSRGAAG